jgi:hypothetical protein
MTDKYILTYLFTHSIWSPFLAIKIYSQKPTGNQPNLKTSLHLNGSAFLMFIHFKMAAAVKGLVSICIVALILATSWLIAVLINYYGGQGKGLSVHKNSDSGPYPGDRMDNIFWFIQV